MHPSLLPRPPCGSLSYVLASPSASLHSHECPHSSQGPTPSPPSPLSAQNPSPAIVGSTLISLDLAAAPSFPATSLPAAAFPARPTCPLLGQPDLHPHLQTCTLHAWLPAPPPMSPVPTCTWKLPISPALPLHSYIRPRASRAKAKQNKNQKPPKYLLSTFL